MYIYIGTFQRVIFLWYGNESTIDEKFKRRKLEYKYVSSIIKQISKYLVVLMGDVRVGKTTLLRKCIESQEKNKTQMEKILPTIAVQFGAATINNVRIKFWDISGQRKFRKLGNQYLKKAAAAIVVFDLTKYDTFHSAKEIISDIRLDPDNNSMPILLFGNKSDLCINAKGKNKYQEDGESGNGLTRAIKRSVALDFMRETPGVIYRQGCGLSDDHMKDGLTELLQKFVNPNKIVYEGQSDSKGCMGCCGWYQKKQKNDNKGEDGSIYSFKRN